MASDTQSIATALEQLQAGRLQAARQACQQLLEQQPNQPEALHLLGVISHKLGERETAVRYLSQSIEQKPGDPSFLSNYGGILQSLGESEQASELLRQALELNPDLAEAHYNLGLVLYDQGHSEQAIGSYREAIRLKPNYAEAYNNLGMALKSQNRPGEALECFARATEYQPQLAEAYHNAGLIYLRQGQGDAAIGHFERAVQLRPSYSEAHCNLGSALQGAGQVEQSVRSFRTALELQPDYPEAHNYMGVSLHILGRLEEAIPCYLEAIRLKPDYTKAYGNMATALADQGKLNEALSRYQKAIGLNPQYEDAIAGEASVYEKQGCFEEAYGLLRPLLEKDTNNINAALVFAKLAHRLNKQPDAASVIERLLATENLPAFRQQMLHFALGKLYDELGQRSQAFSNYKKGNELCAQRFDPQRHETAIGEVIAAYSNENMARWPRNRNGSELPIFIIGMPRSGTSLVEQILASHPEVYGAGELKHIQRMIASLPETLGSRTPYPQCLEQLSGEVVARLADGYVRQLRQCSSDAQRITDKMPQNFLHLGLIALMFPGAAVIHCVRDPIDTCLSCYSHNFLGGHAYSFSLQNLGVYYRQYARIMRHWGEVLDNAILEVSYEDLVENTEELSREMVSFCNLDWDQSCLRFYETKRQVKTASYDEVRRPIYTSSVGRSKQYMPYLKPLLELLEPAER